MLGRFLDSLDNQPRDLRLYAKLVLDILPTDSTGLSAYLLGEILDYGCDLVFHFDLLSEANLVGDAEPILAPGFAAREDILFLHRVLMEI